MFWATPGVAPIDCPTVTGRGGCSVDRNHDCFSLLISERISQRSEIRPWEDMMIKRRHVPRPDLQWVNEKRRIRDSLILVWISSVVMQEPVLHHLNMILLPLPGYVYTFARQSPPEYGAVQDPLKPLSHRRGGPFSTLRGSRKKQRVFRSWLVPKI